MLKRFISIRWKLLLLCLGLVSLPTVVLGVFVYRTYQEEAIQTMRGDLRLIADGWYTATDIYYEELHRVLKREEYLIEKRLGSIALDAKMMIEFFDKLHKGQDPAAEQALLDRLSEIRIGRSGYVCIFDKDGNFVLSNGRRQDGANVYQIRQAAGVEVYRKIMDEAKALQGDDLKVFHYEWIDPGVTDSRKKVAVVTRLPGREWLIGATMFYTDFKSYELERIMQDKLKERMARQRIGAQGYIWVVNSAGTFLVSKDRLRDGESVISARDQKGEMFVLDIIRQAREGRAGETFFKDYTWRNIGEKGPKKKIAAIVYHPQWDWIIGANAYEEDFLKGLATIRWQITLVCFGFIVLGSLLAVFFASLVSRPIRKLEAIAVSGDLDATMDQGVLDSNDEIGRLAKAFSAMMKSLSEKIREIEHSRAELVRINEELRLAQDQLLQSEKLAAIGHLAAGVAHEINNPLAYVMSNVETLERYVALYDQVIDEYARLDEQLDVWQDAAQARDDVRHAARIRNADAFAAVRKDMKELLPELLDGLNRVKRIVIDLKVFARGDRGPKVEARVEDILDKVITLAWNEIKYRADVIREYGQVPPIRCYDHRLAQVFMNMIVNAAQAVEPGKGLIRIKTYTKGNELFVEIRDNGIGIAPEVLARIFDPFFTTKPVGRGTGLGLSISYEIIKKHGGEIRVESASGKGAAFIVVLPMEA